MPILTSHPLSLISHPLFSGLSLPEQFPAFFRRGNDGNLEVTDQIIVVPARIIGLIVGFFLLRWLLHKVIRRFARRTGNGAVAGVLAKSKRGQEFVENTLANERRAQRAETIASLLCSTVTIVLTAVAVVMVLAELGFNILPVVASASIIGVALGFGAQTLVKDFLAGIFMIFEDQYGVGDLVDMEKATGEVLSVGLRVTQLRGEDGTIWYVRNGEVMRLGNLTNRNPNAGSTGVGSAAEKSDEHLTAVEAPTEPAAEAPARSSGGHEPSA
ncbi:small conductance mechanosensitive channel [Kribbella sp. VKM Ac-2527]|uniref:Small conductance mechanosensitive channel n=1 Tax=Kribbella caucasensis TaxID=2512215 RepID=A0A4R6KB99_9ACTN|nr:mechanosensitive ion channel domain-containing protein [Kribbella sp. VKM Ac-2527]TDO47252.1 small conductance mechanosensitive channel [Kribbella sp. VKM Ac-2527]